MKMNSSKMLMSIMLILSTTMSMTSNSIMFTWMSMEMNLISFLPLLTKSKKMKDYVMKYFIIQSMASSLMLMSILINLVIDRPINESILMMSSMLMKLGMMPFHLWMPTLMSASSWMNCLMMTTWQKILPTMMTTQLTNLNTMMLPMMLSMIMSPIIMMKQSSTKKILAYSSISNSSMIILSMMISKVMFFYFMTIYSMITMALINSMKTSNMNFINQMSKETNMKKMMIMINMMSMCGLPPMMGFLMKWMIIQEIIKMSMWMSITIIISSILSMFTYMKMFSTTMFKSSDKQVTKKKNTFNEMFTVINLSGILMPMILKMN